MKKKIPIWLMLLMNFGTFVCGQLFAMYYYWIAEGSLRHDDSLWAMCVTFGFFSMVLNAVQWCVRQTT